MEMIWVLCEDVVVHQFSVYDLYHTKIAKGGSFDRKAIVEADDDDACGGCFIEYYTIYYGRESHWKW
jgi:hypothetical protein